MKHAPLAPLFFALVASACHLPIAGDPDPGSQLPGHPPPTGPQGVDGVVASLVGDFQPCVAPCSTSGVVTPRSSRVFVFRGEHAVVVAVDPNDPSLVATVQADAGGFYQAVLDAGDYAVVAEIDGRLDPSALSPTKADTWAAVHVAAGAWTETSIEDTARAAF